ECWYSALSLGRRRRPALPRTAPHADRVCYSAAPSSAFSSWAADSGQLHSNLSSCDRTSAARACRKPGGGDPLLTVMANCPVCVDDALAFRRLASSSLTSPPRQR